MFTSYVERFVGRTCVCTRATRIYFRARILKSPRQQPVITAVINQHTHARVFIAVRDDIPRQHGYGIITVTGTPPSRIRFFPGRAWIVLGDYCSKIQRTVSDIINFFRIFLFFWNWHVDNGTRGENCISTEPARNNIIAKHARYTQPYRRRSEVLNRLPANEYLRNVCEVFFLNIRKNLLEIHLNYATNQDRLLKKNPIFIRRFNAFINKNSSVNSTTLLNVPIYNFSDP